MTNVLPPLRDKQYGGAWSIHDPSTAEFLQNISHNQGNTEKFVNDYSEWMCENKIIKGIEKYKIKNFSAGTTETFVLSCRSVKTKSNKLEPRVGCRTISNKSCSEQK